MSFPAASAGEQSPGVFGQFAGAWFPAMTTAVLGNAEQAAEDGLHYMLLDVCLLCLAWPDLFPALHKGKASLSPQVKLAADALMDHLVRGCNLLLLRLLTIVVVDHCCDWL